MLGTWNKTDYCIELTLSATGKRAVICGIFSDNNKEEFVIVQYDRDTGHETPIETWNNCDPTKRSRVRTLLRGATYRIYPKYVGATCGSGMNTSPSHAEPVPASDYTDPNTGQVTFWLWDFEGNSSEKAALTIMLVDNNMGGGGHHADHAHAEGHGHAGQHNH